jgi:NAD(P)H-dependent flavin oxidoreductase YrpB (nitropropane dioxygenase family)
LEGQAARDAGCDFLIAQGVEAGGHVRGTCGLLPLLDEVLADAEIPVLAAGGIGSPRAMAAVLAAGASGVRVGTRFVAARESAAHPDYVEALVEANAYDTVLTTEFSVMWPDAPHRVLSSCVQAVRGMTDEVVGEMPVGDTRIPIPRRAVLPPLEGMSGTIAAMALYAGESVGSVHGRQLAGEIVRELADGAERLLHGWSPTPDLA